MPVVYRDLTFEQQQVRVIDRNGDLWLVLTDVCRIFDLDNPSCIASLDADEKDTISINYPVEEQPTTIVSNPGLYRLTAISDKAAAKRFLRCMRHGFPDLNDPTLLQKLLLENVTARIEAEEKLRAADAKVIELQKKVAFYEQHADARDNVEATKLRDTKSDTM